MIDKINDSAEENRVSFTTAGGCIHQTAFSIDDMLPGLLLKNKRLAPLFGKPFTDYFIAGRCFQS